MRVNEDDVMDITEYASVMEAYKDVYAYLATRYMQCAKGAEKKFRPEDEEANTILVGAISYASLMNAVTNLHVARAVLETDAIDDLIDGFIQELTDLKNSPLEKQ